MAAGITRRQDFDVFGSQRERSRSTHQTSGHDATVSGVQYLGPVSHVFCEVDGGGKVIASSASTSSTAVSIGQRVKIAWPADAAVEIT